LRISLLFGHGLFRLRPRPIGNSAPIRDRVDTTK
jgi:hypothetical protein